MLQISVICEVLGVYYDVIVGIPRLEADFPDALWVKQRVKEGDPVETPTTLPLEESGERLGETRRLTQQFYFKMMS